MEMAKLSPAQVKALRAIRDNRVEQINARTLSALRGMFAIKQDAGNGAARLAGYFSLTPIGRAMLDEHERAERAKQEQAERASRPVPAGAFVEPSARTAPVMGLEYDEDEGKPAAPAVRLTPRPEDVEQEATDAEILQLLTLMDAGIKVTRGLSQAFALEGTLPFSVDLDALNRAARDAVRFWLARQTYASRRYRLEVEPIHLLTGDGQVTPCGRYLEAARNSGKRLRVTADPTKVTHDFCK